MVSSAFKRKEKNKSSMMWEQQPQKCGNRIKCKVQALYHNSGIEHYRGDPVAISSPLAISRSY